MNAYKGSQWAVCNARDVHGPQQAHVCEKDESKGDMMEPSCTYAIHLSTALYYIHYDPYDV